MRLDECSQLSTLLGRGGYNENYLQSMCYPAGIFIQAEDVSADFVDKGKSNYIFANITTSILICYGHQPPPDKAGKRRRPSTLQPPPKVVISGTSERMDKMLGKLLRSF